MFFFWLYTHPFNIFVVKHYLSLVYAYCSSLLAGLLAWFSFHTIDIEIFCRLYYV